jgi:16S rRNA (cytidine1402-2'-O)-methyltransferase
VPELIARVCAGDSVALVSDAGTPCISDPGFRLVRAAHGASLGVTAVPGPCAVVAALSVAGIPTDRFTFEGFLPARGAARKRALEALRTERRTMVFFEAGRRLGQTLSEMVALFGAEREAAVVREITKTHEETIRAALGEMAERFTDIEPLGEVTIVVEGARQGEGPREQGESAEVMLEAMLEVGIGLKQASAAVAKLKGLSRREVYNQALKSHRPSTD